MFTSKSGAVVVGDGISGCLAALSLRCVLDDVEIVDRRNGSHMDFPMTIGRGLEQELRALGLEAEWNDWEGKRLVNSQLSAWGTPEIEREIDLIPNVPRYLVHRVALEKFLKRIVDQRGIKARSTLDPKSADWVVVDASGRSGEIALHRGAKRREGSPLVVIQGVSIRSSLADACVIVQSAEDGWWFGVGERGHATVMYFSVHTDLLDHREPAFAPPKSFASLIGEAQYGIPVTFASMSWLEIGSADNWFAVGESVLSVDPILGSGVDVAAQSAQLLREAIQAPDPHILYNASIDKLVGKYRIARHRLYSRGFDYHGGPFWLSQLQL